MGSHALLSASSSHRWMTCTPSPILEQQFEETTSIYADEGTAAHALSEYKIRKFLGLEEDRPISPFDSPELDAYTDIYVDFASECISKAYAKSKDAVVLVEKCLDFSNYVPEGFGTGDLVIVTEHELEIIDLKYGKGLKVEADYNPQMMLYALGALNLFDILYDIQNIKMTICQPRLDHISTFEMKVSELYDWAEKEVKPKAELAFKGEGTYISGSHCRFCRARFNCKARAEASLALTKYDFKSAALLTDQEICEVLMKVDELTTWASDVKTFAQDQAINHNKYWTGFKIVEGRSNRRYIDESKVIDVLMATGEFPEDKLYTKTLINITSMEKLMGKKKFNELLSDMIDKPAGKLTLVPESDKRSEYNSASNDFNN